MKNRWEAVTLIVCSAEMIIMTGLMSAYAFNYETTIFIYETPVTSSGEVRAGHSRARGGGGFPPLNMSFLSRWPVFFLSPLDMRYGHLKYVFFLVWISSFHKMMTFVFIHLFGFVHGSLGEWQPFKTNDPHFTAPSVSLFSQCVSAVCWTSWLGLQATLKQMLFFYHGMQAAYELTLGVFFTLQDPCHSSLCRVQVIREPIYWHDLGAILGTICWSSELGNN